MAAKICNCSKRTLSFSLGSDVLRYGWQIQVRYLEEPKCYRRAFFFEPLVRLVNDKVVLHRSKLEKVKLRIIILGTDKTTNRYGALCVESPRSVTMSSVNVSLAVDRRTVKSFDKNGGMKLSPSAT